jgi:hypothetical protein
MRLLALEWRGRGVDPVLPESWSAKSSLLPNIHFNNNCGNFIMHYGKNFILFRIGFCIL